MAPLPDIVKGKLTCFSHHVFLSLESRVVLVSTVVPRHKGSEHLKYSQSELRCAVREKNTHWSSKT